MSIQMLGIDHSRAPVDVRAIFSFTKKNAAAAMDSLKKDCGVEGCIILSTCNRMEIWVSAPEDWQGSLLEELCRIKEVDPTEFREYFVERRGEEAVDHLFHLACGLKSMILAEDQILTQVGDALALAREFYMTDSVLEVLFRKAVTAAKRVKTDVVFSRASETAMDRAVEMLKNQGFDLKGKRCMVIGNGEMGRLAALTLASQGAILTQVGDALALAREFYMTDSVLEVLFRKAVTAAKRVKTDVVFSRASETAMDRAVEMLKNQGFDLKGKRCMVIGNGEMGRLAALTLASQGADVTVTVRQYRSGVVKIPLGCKRIDYGERMELFPRCDLVVSATASPNYTLKLESVRECALDHSICLIDLAVPRDIEPAIGRLEQIRLYDIDDFKSSGDHTNEAAYEQAEYILHEEMEEFYAWLNGRDLIPRIQEIQQDAVTDLNLRIRKIIRKLPMEEADQEKLLKNIDTAAGKVVGKMMFGLRDTLERDSFLECVAGLEKLYEPEA